ncbi:hypothetical protein H5410_023046 [Solanum commersonii]|uniref:Uncharacterized protein n=1 Tax=Solanum commersonii TaxID=4109 RepID=A0A9J5ZH67_SOLCO|nr:hypothetical protein H5410_023046 [Solanum commersonii]
MASPKFLSMSFLHFLLFLAICLTVFIIVLMVLSVLSEMKKGNNATNFEKKRFYLEYKSINEWSEKPIYSACIKELKEHLEKLHNKFDQLKTKYEKLTSFVNYVKTLPDEKVKFGSKNF